MTQKYVSLHTHSRYSVLDGFASVEHMAKRAKALGMPAVGITDHGDCGGHYDFQQVFLENGVEPIFGMEGYLVDSVEKTREEKSKLNSHYCIWAESQQGLSNLWAISSLAYLDGFYYRPLADWDMIKPYAEGLVVSDGCMMSNSARYILEDDMDSARQWLGKFMDTFGEENVYVELHTWQFVDPKNDKERGLNEDMTKINQGKIKLAQELGLPMIVVNDAHYAERCDHENHSLVWSISTGNTDKTDGDSERAAWIMSDDEVYEWMERHGVSRSITEEAIENTHRIYERCKGVRIEKKDRLPLLTGDMDKDREVFLDKVQEGFSKVIEPRHGNESDEEREERVRKSSDRIMDEVSMIVEKGFHGYFNVVADYTSWARNADQSRGKEPWLIGPSRGSGGGSQVARLMEITAIDPEKYGLIFERFLTRERKGYPDFDVDFPQAKRPEMMQYLKDRWGNDKVCGIGTFSLLKPKGLLKDLSKANGIAFKEANDMSKILDKADLDEKDEDWAEALAEVEELQPYIRKYPGIFSKLRDMQGLVRQTSKHAAGVLISNTPLLGDLPLRVKNGEVVSQFDMIAVEALGFIKFDILGIRHLDTIMDVDRMVHGDVDPYRYYNLTPEDYARPEPWNLIEDGHTKGIFQIETPGGTKVGKVLRPKNEVDMADLISVNRPGVIKAGMLDVYLERRNGEAKVMTPHPLMDDILSNTFGVVVYQEQVMRIVRSLAHFSMEEADAVRKILGKRKADQMDELKPEFIERCLRNEEFMKLLPNCSKDYYSDLGIVGTPRPELVAEQCWNQIVATGSYAFNLSHAMGYSLIGTWETHLKHDHLPQFLTAQMRTAPDEADVFIREARLNHVPILPPDINVSDAKYSYADGKIRYGLNSIKGVGDSAVEEIIANRPYESLQDYLDKTTGRKGKKKDVLTKLIKIGAFDTLGERSEILSEFFEIAKIKDPIPDFSDGNVVTEIENELVGTFITHDPLQQFIPVIESMGLSSPDDVKSYEVGDTFMVGGQISKVHEHQARNGAMGFCEITWKEETYPFTAFTEQYQNNKPFLKIGAPVLAEVTRGEDYRGEVSCVLKKLVRLDMM